MKHGWNNFDFRVIKICIYNIFPELKKNEICALTNKFMFFPMNFDIVNFTRLINTWHEVVIYKYKSGL